MKEIKVLVLVAMAFALASCGAKTATAIVEEPVKETTKVTIKAEGLEGNKSAGSATLRGGRLFGP